MSARWMSFASLLSSSSTLVCCALPALFVSLGAGAAFVSVTSAFPFLITLSEYKVPLFISATLMIAVSGFWLWRSRHQACPLDPQLRDACQSTRRWSFVSFWISVGLLVTGALFAFVPPYLL